MTKETLELGLATALKATEVEVEAGAPRPWDGASKLTVVGTREPRVDGAAKVSGAAEYTTDVRRPGMLYAEVLRSPHPAAVVRRIDLARAAKMPGVRAVIAVAKEGDRLLFEGQEVAAVAADAPRLARDAMRAIEVFLTPLPHVTDVEAAMAVGSPEVISGSPNLRGPLKNRFTDIGDVNAAWEGSAAQVELTFRTQVQTHSCHEPHGAVVEVTRDGGLEVWTSTQSIASVVGDLSGAFGLPASKIRVHCEYLGGGFGSKFGAGRHTIIAAQLARASGRAVRLILDRRAEHLAGGNRPSSKQRVRLAADASGKLRALELESIGGPGVGGGGGAGGFYGAIYDVPNRKLVEHDVSTNTGPAAAFRAPGHPQGCFALESSLDALATKLRIDPIELRLANDTHPARRAQWKLARERFGWEELRKRGPRAEGPWRIGVGCASSVWYNIVELKVGATVEIHSDGSVVVLSGAQDIGGGIRTIIAQVAAEVLGLPTREVTVRIGDSALPLGPGSGGSKTTASLTPAVREAAEHARSKLAELAERNLGGPALRFEAGRVVGPNGSLAFAQAAKLIRSGKLTGHGERKSDLRGLDASEDPAVRKLANLIAGVQLAEAAVNLETGIVRVRRILAVQDCGRVMNSLLARSQVNGGVIQGLGYALYEERVLDRFTGRMLNANLDTYRIATLKDLPEIDVVLTEVFSGRSSTGAMGLGEPATVPTAAAISNAVAHATGARMTELPLSPERVLTALRSPS
ncbi:MAG: xanthine dehydrogenase family protein molybdopterin-binding subunit [Deltaproteobacteria bacterium]|nr:xanthine dehydrogenase family protein molybdopterin-binding subunit [Deltaproteobacteria bacterium]